MIRVNSTEFDETAIVKEMQYHTAKTHTEAKNKASEALIISELLKQRAAKLELVGADVKIGLREEKADEKVEEEGFLEALLALEVDYPEANEADSRNYFNANPKKFMTTPLIEAKHILFNAAPDDANARSEAIELAEQLIKRLTDDPSSFSDLAILHSKCPSAKTGGQLGQLGKGQTVPEFERQLFNCPLGLASAPIESRYGIHIVYIDRLVEGKVLPYEMVKERIADYMNEKVRRKAIAQYIHRLISDAEIEGFDFSVSDSQLMQ
jgi:peptidyl-prolyl cis-trans isomerase C